MTTGNCYNWWAVNMSENMLPGDTDQIRSISARYSQLESYFRDMVDILETVSDHRTALSGEWYQRFSDRASDLKPDFDAFAEAFDQVSRAIGQWGNDLEVYLGKARYILDQAAEFAQQRSDYQGQLRTATSNLHTAQNIQNDLPDDADVASVRSAQNAVDNAASDVANLNAKVAGCQQDLENQKSSIQRIIDEYNAEGERCARKILDAGNCIPDERVYERIGYSDLYGGIAKALEITSLVFAVVALFFSGGWITVLFVASTVLAYATGPLSEFAKKKITGRMLLGETLLSLISMIPAFGEIGKASSFGKAAKAVGSSHGIHISAGGVEATEFGRFISNLAYKGKDGIAKLGDFFLNGNTEVLRNVSWPAVLKNGDATIRQLAGYVFSGGALLDGTEHLGSFVKSLEINEYAVSLRDLVTIHAESLAKAFELPMPTTKGGRVLTVVGAGGELFDNVATPFSSFFTSEGNQNQKTVTKGVKDAWVKSLVPPEFVDLYQGVSEK